MARNVNRKRAMQLNQDELETLKNLVNSAKILVYSGLQGSLQKSEITDLEKNLNAFGKALVWDNEKILDPKVKY